MFIYTTYMKTYLIITIAIFAILTIYNYYDIKDLKDIVVVQSYVIERQETHIEDLYTTIEKTHNQTIENYEAVKNIENWISSLY